MPMTAGCVVPRGDVLELIDDIGTRSRRTRRRPGRSRRPRLDVARGQEHAESAVSGANAEADSVLSHARSEADRLLADAKSQADRMVAEARQHSERMVTEAREEASRLSSAAKRLRGRHHPGQSGGRPSAGRTATSPTRTRCRKASGAAAAGLGDRGGSGGQRRGDRLVDAAHARPTGCAGVRHLRRQQTGSVRGVPQRHPALGQPRPPPAAHRGGTHDYVQH